MIWVCVCQKKTWFISSPYPYITDGDEKNYGLSIIIILRIILVGWDTIVRFYSTVLRIMYLRVMRYNKMYA
jgi:hypothetical protein